MNFSGESNGIPDTVLVGMFVSIDTWKNEKNISSKRKSSYLNVSFHDFPLIPSISEDS